MFRLGTLVWYKPVASEPFMNLTVPGGFKHSSRRSLKTSQKSNHPEAVSRNPPNPNNAPWTSSNPKIYTIFQSCHTMTYLWIKSGHALHGSFIHGVNSRSSIWVHIYIYTYSRIKYMKLHTEAWPTKLKTICEYSIPCPNNCIKAWNLSSLPILLCAQNKTDSNCTHSTESEWLPKMLRPQKDWKKTS